MSDNTWTDFLMRTNTGDAGTVPGPGPASSSPDIIPWGPTQVDDPQTTFSDNYGSNPGKSLITNTINTLYVRSKNLSPDANSGKVSLYWASSSYILWPHTQGDVKGWSENIIPAANGKDTIEISADPDAVAVTQNPFLWNPSPPAPGTHYCLIAGVATDEHPQIVPENDEVNTGGEWANWVLNHRNVGWRNVALSDSGAATSSRLDNFQNGTDEQTYMININCENCPIGWEVELKSYNNTPPLPNPAININRTRITDDTFFGTFVKSTVPANYFSLLAINIYNNGIQPDKRWDISVDATVEKENSKSVADIPIKEVVVVGGVQVAIAD